MVDTLILIPGKIDQIILHVDVDDLINNNLISLEKRVSDKMNELEDLVKIMSFPANNIKAGNMIAEINW